MPYQIRCTSRISLPQSLPHRQACCYPSASPQQSLLLLARSLRYRATHGDGMRAADGQGFTHLGHECWPMDWENIYDSRSIKISSTKKVCCPGATVCPGHHACRWGCGDVSRAPSPFPCRRGLCCSPPRPDSGVVRRPRAKIRDRTDY